MHERKFTDERQEQISEESIRYERAMRVRNYFADRKEAARIREEIVRNLMSEKYDSMVRTR